MNEQPRRGSLLVIFLTVFIDLLGFGIVLPLLPIYADQFTVDASGWLLGLLMASFSAMQFVFAPIWGRISDHIGRRPVILIGLAGSVAFYTLFGVATVAKSIFWLFVSRIGAGIAGATISTAQAYIADSTSLARRPKGMALIGMAFGLGFTFGPLLGFLAVPDRNAEAGPWPGYAAAILSAVALVLAWIWLPESGDRTRRSTERGLLDFESLRQAVALPSVGLLLATLFVCMFSFAGFETTLSLLIKGSQETAGVPFQFSWGQVCLTYAYIGLTLAVVQGLVVRRLAGRWDESRLAIFGGCVQISGFALMIAAIGYASTAGLLFALGTVVTGISFMSPNLNSLISRRSDPSKQGMVMGVAQSVSSLARILGSALGIPMLRAALVVPYLVAAGLMGFGLILLIAASRRGADYAGSAQAIE
jgi:MFS family permease